MNADDKTHWLNPSPPIAVDGYPSHDDHGEANSGFVPAEPPEIPTSNEAAEILPRPRRVDAIYRLCPPCLFLTPSPMPSPAAMRAR
jgi:hypothetical protein